MDILFVLMLAAVVAVLLMYCVQRRSQHRESLRAAVLAAQVELLKAASGDADLAVAAAGPQLAGDPAGARRHLFLDAQVTVWELHWRLGALSERQVRAHAEALMAREEGRRFWQRAGATRAAVVGEDDKLRVFNQIFAVAHQGATTASAR
ncbi:DUF6082 family protein [Streptomyces sp. NPDC001584]|uniref:DUF6082 family protein n=1 Tax=Streptomyces sp. NPDC001584 TaxID=3154521 RepID=UPI00332658B6